MIAYISVGVNDMDLARRFYTSFLPDLGYEWEESHEGIAFALPVEPGQTVIWPEFYVKPPFNGEPASNGNGTMVAFEAKTQQQVRDLHAAGLAGGGTDEGAPGFREYYGPRFYVGYLRDPQGNKIALFASNPDEPSRDD